MNRTFPAAVASLILLATAGGACAQATQTPAPAQAGDDPSMAQPKGPAQPALQSPQPVQNPESTVGLAPTDQPVNNIKPRVAGEIVPSSQETAAHNPSIFEHDQQPILTHTFNFTADQKRTIVEALAQEKASPAGDQRLEETMVVPPSIGLNPMPDRIADVMPWVKPYYYLKTGDRIVLINPLGRSVVAVID